MVKRDQNGVVWICGGDGYVGMLMSEAGYRGMCRRFPGWVPYEDLPIWDSHEQNLIDVDGSEDGTN